jgi:hypothetical protein
MDDTITYLNTDLCLISEHDLTPLAQVFEAAGVPPMYGLTVGDDGKNYASFNTKLSYREPEPNITAMLAVIESLPAPIRHVWDRLRQPRV